MDSSSQQNAAILACPYSSTWPLVLDPLGMAEDWIRKSGDKLLSTKYQVYTVYNSYFFQAVSHACI